MEACEGLDGKQQRGTAVDRNGGVCTPDLDYGAAMWVAESLQLCIYFISKVDSNQPD